MIFIYMEELNRFKKYLVESKDSVSSSKINEEDMPEFTETDKEILQFVADHIGAVEEGSEPNPFEVANSTLNQYYFINKGNVKEGLDFLKRAGGIDIFDFLFEKADEFSMVDSIVEDIKNKEWDSVARLYALWRGEEVLLASEIIAQAIATDEPFTEEDIEDLEKELNFLAS